MRSNLGSITFMRCRRKKWGAESNSPFFVCKWMCYIFLSVWEFEWYSKVAYVYTNRLENAFHFFSLHLVLPHVNRLLALQVIHILSLYQCGNLTETPNYVENLKHLHSLDFSYTHIEKLPNSRTLLNKSQILNLKL